MNLLPLRAGIGLVYFVVVLLIVFGAGTPDAWKNPLAYALLAMALIGLGLHIAIVAISRSWVSGALALLSVLGLFSLVLIALMKVTGDSL